jgi:hypothetical protein
MQMLTCQANPEVLPNFCHRDKIWLPNEVKADEATALRVSGRASRSNADAQIDMRLQCDRANVAVRARSYIVTADIRLVFWNKI